jgi:hypothetical protein
MDIQILKIETMAEVKQQLIKLKLSGLDKERQDIISKSKEADIYIRALDSLSLATKSPYVQMSISKTP